MDRLARIQRISGVLRYLLLLVAVALGAAFVLAVLVPGQGLVTLGDGQLNELHASGAIGPGLMLVVITPMGLVLALGVYWLQRLFGEYQRGQFFTDGSMRCYLWLVWLKVAGFAYGVLWPVLLGAVLPDRDSANLSVNIEAGTIIELVLLLFIVHLLKAAQQIHDENRAFV